MKIKFKEEAVYKLNNKQLIEYKKELDKYKKFILDQASKWAPEMKRVRIELRMREQDLELQCLLLEDERLNEYDYFDVIDFMSENEVH